MDSKRRWTRSADGYSYELRDADGTVLAEVYRGGGKWYPWSWWVRNSITGKGPSGTTTTMRDAKASAEARINGQ
jgi:hypothetical protein